MDKTNPYKVYRITCLVNGKLYFGITKRKLSLRMKQHRRYANSGSNFLISRAIRKHGWDNFKVDVVAEALTKDEACKIESFLIEKHKTCYELGYNMTPGGQTGVSLRPETRRKKSMAAKLSWFSSEAVRAVVKNPERNRKIGENSKRLHKDPVYREKFLSRHKEMVARSLDPECRRRAIETMKKNGNCTKVRCSNGMEFDSIAEAAEWVSSVVGGEGKGKRSQICACVNGRRNKAFGLKWERMV